MLERILGSHPVGKVLHDSRWQATMMLSVKHTAGILEQGGQRELDKSRKAAWKNSDLSWPMEDDEDVNREGKEGI